MSDPVRQAIREEPATILLHKPVGYDTISGRKAAAGLVQPDTHWPDDPSGVPVLEQHFHRLTPLVPLAKMPVGMWRYLPVGERF